MTYIAASEEEIARRREANKRALERAKKAQEEIDWTLRDSERRMKRIRADLRRAGLLRD